MRHNTTRDAATAVLVLALLTTLALAEGDEGLDGQCESKGDGDDA